MIFDRAVVITRALDPDLIYCHILAGNHR